MIYMDIYIYLYISIDDNFVHPSFKCLEIWRDIIGHFGSTFDQRMCSHSLISKKKLYEKHYNDVTMIAMASQITSITTVYSTVYWRRRSKKTSKPRVSGLCCGNSPVIDEFPTQRASNAVKVSIWWRHHANTLLQSAQCPSWIITARRLHQGPFH